MRYAQDDGEDVAGVDNVTRWPHRRQRESTSSFDGKCQTVAYDGTLLVDDVADDNLLGDLFDDSARENGNYWVLDTDYTSFAIVYSCTSFRGIGRTGLMPVHN